MKQVRILYCSNGEPIINSLLNKAVAEVERNYGLEVGLTYRHSYPEFMGMLNRVNGNFQLAVLRISHDGKELPTPKDEINHRFRGALVAESPRYSYRAQDVKQHFDDYTGLIMHYKNLEELLRRRGFLPDNPKL